MRTLFYLSESQLERIKHSSLFPGVPCVDDQRVVKVSDMLSSMDFGGRMFLKNTGRKALHNRFIRWSDLGGFSRVFTRLANWTPFNA